MYDHIFFVINIQLKKLVKCYFVQGTEDRNHDLVEVYKEYFERHVQPMNLALFLDSYIRRSDLNIFRETEPAKKSENTIKMAVMNITGAFSPHVDDTVTLNGRLDPTNSTWMKVRAWVILLPQEETINFVWEFPDSGLRNGARGAARQSQRSVPPVLARAGLW